MDEFAKLQIRIDANTARFDSGMRKASSGFGARASEIEQRASQMDRRVGRSFNNVSRRGRAAFGNVSQQLQDVVVQAQMGTDAFKILGQQGPQIAGAFGPAGAALGVFVALGAVAAGSLFNLTSDAKKATSAIKALEGAQTALNKTQDLLSMSLLEIQQRFGDNVDEVNRLRVSLAELQVAEVTKKIADLGMVLADTFGDFTNAPAVDLNITGFGAEEARKRFIADLEQISSQFNVTQDQAQKLNAAMRQFQDASSSEGQIRALERIEALFKEFGVDLSKIPPEIRAALTLQKQQRLALLEADKAAQDLRDSISDGADETGKFITKAQQLKTELAEAARQARIAFEQASASAKLRFRDEESLFALPVTPTPVENTAEFKRQAEARAREQAEIARRLSFRFRDEEALFALPVEFSGPKPKKKKKGGGGSQREDTAAQRIVERGRERLRDLQNETRLVGLLERTRAQLAAQFEREKFVRDLVEAAARDGATISKEEIADAKATALAIEAQTLALFDAEQAQKRFAEATEAAKERQEELAQSVEQVSNQILGAIQSAESFADALRLVGFELLKIASSAAVGEGPLGDAFNKAIGVTSGGLFGLINSPSLGSFASSNAVGGAALGGGGAFDFGNLLVQNAKGNAFSGGKVIPFAKGGVISSPTTFPMAQGVGLMGESGPEAIMPLKRGRGGRLGVEGGGGGTVINISNVFEGVNGATQAQLQTMLAQSEAKMMQAIPGVAAAGQAQRPALRRR